MNVNFMNGCWFKLLVAWVLVMFFVKKQSFYAYTNKITLLLHPILCKGIIHSYQND
ncbi:hypothetical protein SAMN06265379_101307 [Saccharicrinis carchari]|uniref:Uncharacterized protein n=1 Tax=Saccharicrinis carchari TaxID=1168039 RepID=A0A521APP4_SACCC|nr:hypothetical protein SAMN06265379_101307 [Saccharicrinis carchari]